MSNAVEYLELRCLRDDVEVGQLFHRYSKRDRCRGVPLYFVRDLASKLPSAIRKLTTNVRGDQFNSDVVVRPGDNLSLEMQRKVSF